MNFLNTQVKLRIDFHCLRLIVIKIKTIALARFVALKMLSLIIYRILQRNLI